MTHVAEAHEDDQSRRRRALRGGAVERPQLARRRRTGSPRVRGGGCSGVVEVGGGGGSRQVEGTWGRHESEEEGATKHRLGWVARSSYVKHFSSTSHPTCGNEVGAEKLLRKEKA